MPAYVGPEYDAFRGDLVAWEEAAVEDEEEIGEVEAAAAAAVRESAWGDLRRSAHTLASVVQVATAQLKEVSATDVLLHQYHAQPVVDRAASDAIRSLSEAVAELSEEVVALRQAVVSLRATDGSGAAVSRSTRQVEQSAGGSSTASGRGRSVRVRGGRGCGGHTGRGDLDDSVRRRSDSELSDIPDNLSDMVID